MKVDLNNVIVVINLLTFNVLTVIWCIVINVIRMCIMVKDLLNIYEIIYKNKADPIKK